MPVFDPLNGMIADIRGSKYLFLRDIERCPFVPKDSGYERWNRDDIERAQRIHEARKEMHERSNSYLSHEDRHIRQMAMFISWLFN